MGLWTYGGALLPRWRGAVIAMDGILLATLGVILAALGLMIAHRSPRFAVVLALASVCFVPIWIGARIGFNGNLFAPAAVLATTAVAVALLPVRGLRPSPIDAVLGLLLLFATVSFVTSDPGLALSFLVTPFSYFVGGYAFGRIAAAQIGVDTVYAAVAILFTVVAVLAIVEFVTGINPFTALRVDGSLYREWGDIQPRGGINRAEGAFGHPIALGCCLALAIPLALAARLHFVLRLGMVGLMLVATVLTFSRIGIICAFLGVALCALFLVRRLSGRQRVALVAGGVALALPMLPLVTTILGAAGDEASNSADYRADLFPLLTEANLVGFADSVNRSPVGNLSFGNFVSIDSQLVLTGLTSGLLALFAVVLVMVAAIILLLRGRAEPATIAVIAQLPALATVALITQYTVMLWLVVGVAATSQALARPAQASSRMPLAAPRLTPVPLFPSPLRPRSPGE